MSAPAIRFGRELLTAVKVELFTLGRSYSAWLLVSVPVLVAVLRLLAFKFQTVRQSMVGDEANSTITGFGYMVDGFSAGFVALYLLFLVYAALNFASDRDSGVVRHLVVRSVSRRSLLLAKFLVQLVLAAVTAVLVISVCVLLSGSLWELGPVVENGYEIIGVEDIIPEIRTGLALALLPLPACIAVGLTISVAAKNAVRAIVAALALGMGFDLFKNALGDAAHYFVFVFQPAINDQSYLKDVAAIARGFSDILIDERVYQLNVWLPLPQAVVLLVVALVIVNRRTL